MYARGERDWTKEVWALIQPGHSSTVNRPSLPTQTLAVRGASSAWASGRQRWFCSEECVLSLLALFHKLGRSRFMNVRLELRSLFRRPSLKDFKWISTLYGVYAKRGVSKKCIGNFTESRSVCGFSILKANMEIAHREWGYF